MICLEVEKSVFLKSKLNTNVKCRVIHTWFPIVSAHFLMPYLTTYKNDEGETTSVQVWKRFRGVRLMPSKIILFAFLALDTVARNTDLLCQESAEKYEKRRANRIMFVGAFSWNTSPQAVSSKSVC